MPNRYSQQPGQATAPDERQPYTPVPEDYAGENNPYRGTETHGVAPSVPPYDVPDYDDARPVVFEIAEPEPEPIPVRVVGEHSREMHDWALTKLPLNEARAYQLAGRDLRRTSLMVRNEGPDSVYVSPDNNVATYLAIELGPGDSLNLSTQNDVWGTVVTGQTAVVLVSTEFKMEL
jgi:hypothetical protein